MTEMLAVQSRDYTAKNAQLGSQAQGLRIEIQQLRDEVRSHRQYGFPTGVVPRTDALTQVVAKLAICHLQLRGWPTRTGTYLVKVEQFQ